MNINELLLNCKNIKVLGVYKDPDGAYPDMPLFELSEETPEEWNKKCERQRRKNLEDKSPEDGVI